jgi:mono/diheme cytochrome c family protein
MTNPILRITLSAVSAAALLVTGLRVLAADESPSAATPPASLGIRFIEGSTSTMMLERDGKQYLVDLAAKTVKQQDAPASSVQKSDSGAKSQADGAAIFKQRCSGCHGADGKGLSSMGTPDFTDPKVLGSLTDQQIVTTIENGKGSVMPAWRGKLSPEDINAAAAYLRSFSTAKTGPQTAAGGEAGNAAPSNIYEPGDDLLFSLPTGRRRDEHGFYVNFDHRFAFDPPFEGPARGGDLLGLDGFSLSSFGFGYGVTKNLSVDVFRSPTLIARPIQLMGAYNFLDEHDGQPLNAAVRLSIEGRNDFSRQYTENIEGIFSRSITSRAQIYLVPTLSLNDRMLVQPTSTLSQGIPSVPGYTSFALGFGAAFDIRPTVALVIEINPTLIGGDELDIHRPAYSIGIQKKILRHAFTLGFTNSPGSTVSQRSGTLAAYQGRPGADTPSGIIIGFDLTRQLH